MSRSNHNSAYKRGVILGLTMAEIMILIVFLLLLAFASLLQREKKQNEALTHLLAKDGEAVERIVQAVSAQEPDMAADTVRIVEKMPKVISMIRDSDLAELDETVDQTLVRAVEMLKAQKQMKAAQGEGTVEQQLVEALQKQQELQAEIDTLGDQKQNLMAQIKKTEGKGIDWPPCWLEKENKERPEFIFGIDLTDNGLIITDIAPAHRRAAMQTPPLVEPLQKIKYGTVLSVGEFLSQTDELYKLAVKKECRYHAYIYDKTGVHEKLLYKKLAGTVSRHFRTREPKRNAGAIDPTSGSQNSSEPDPNTAHEKPSFLDSIF